MKKLLFTFSLGILAVASINAQLCTPNSTLQPNAVDPNSEAQETFVNGLVGTYYEDVYSIHVPENVSGILNVTHIKYKGITGLPAGLDAEVNPTDSIWLGGTIGCVKISGTPTVTGTFNLVLLQDLKLELSPTPQAFNNNAYTITISDPSTEIELQNLSQPLHVFSVYSINDNISLGLINNNNENVIISIYSITGQIINTSNYNLIKGTNRIEIPTHGIMENGIYFISINSKNSSVNSRLFFNKQ